MRFWCHSSWRRASLHSRLHIHANTAGLHTAWIFASRFSFSLSLFTYFMWHWEIFVQSMMTSNVITSWNLSSCSLYRQVPRHFGLCTLNCQHLVKRIETWQRFYLSCLCSSFLPMSDTVLNVNHKRHVQNIVAHRLKKCIFYRHEDVRYWCHGCCEAYWALMRSCCVYSCQKVWNLCCSYSPSLLMSGHK